MSGRRWSRWLGPPIAFVAVALVLGRFQPGVEAGGRVTPRPAGVCAQAVPSLRGLRPELGTWWRLVDRLDASGTLVGRTLIAGRGGATNLTLELGAESSASGPVGGMIVVTSDDGRFSNVQIVSALEGCSWLVHRSEDVARSAILDASRGAVLAHYVTRETRDDKGVWRIAGMDPASTLQQVLGALSAPPGLAPVWATELRLDPAGGKLAVQSCGELRCVTRVASIDGAGEATELLAGPDQGSIIGFDGARIVTWAHCQGLPCSVQSWASGRANPQLLVDQAVGAALTRDGRTVLAVLDDTGRAVRLDLAGSAGQRILGVSAGDLPLGSGVGAYAGLEVGAGEIALAAPGADARAFNLAGAAPAP
ncbi:MAG: hypothetical protein HYX55_07980 [Chloroflexi bacterium]|nr:hypothetical protein [Chloroflexota bacterium]